MVFAGYSGFLHYLQLASHELAIIGINVTKNEIPNPRLIYQGIPLMARSEGYVERDRNVKFTMAFFDFAFPYLMC